MCLRTWETSKHDVVVEIGDENAAEAAKLPCSEFAERKLGITAAAPHENAPVDCAERIEPLSILLATERTTALPAP